MIAVCNSNFCGDTLWSVPAARELARRAGCKADFWLSLRGAATADLLREQSFVNKVFVRQDSDSTDITPEGDYSAVHPLHMRFFGEWGGTLLDCFCRVAALPRQGHWFDLPVGVPRSELPEGPFVTVVAKSDDSVFHGAACRVIREMVTRLSVPVVEVGPPGSAIALGEGSLDRTSWGFLEMAAIISKCKVFVGTISAPLVLADAFPDVHRIAMHDGGTWDLERCTRSPMNHYLSYPTGRQLAELVGSRL